MPKTRFRFGDISGIVPAIDARGSDKIFALYEDLNQPVGNRNYSFQSKGPISNFGTRLIARNQVIEDVGGNAQSIDVGGYAFLFTKRGAYILGEGLQYERQFEQLLDLSGVFSDVSNSDHLKWSAAYSNSGIYFCHPVYGFYKLVITDDGPELQIRTQEHIPGLPGQPQAVAETNGRLIVLGSNSVGWSGPSSSEDFVPALAGSGFQVLADVVPGAPMFLVGFPIGFIVWTTQGCMSSEFIGGDLVFRHNRITTEQLPLNAHAIEAFPDGSQLICTRQGLFAIENGSEPRKTAEVFSEFLRQILEHEPGIHVRITYQLGTDLCYVQLRDWTNHFVRTFVLAVALDKWGVFTERHLGFIKFLPNRDSIGFVDSKGVAHHFVDYAWNREVTPHVFTGLNSELTIGYVKPPELQGEIDTLHEMQEIFIGGFPARPSWSVPEYTDLGFLTGIGLAPGEFILAGKDMTGEIQEGTAEAYAVADVIIEEYTFTGIPFTYDDLLSGVDESEITQFGLPVGEDITWEVLSGAKLLEAYTFNAQSEITITIGFAVTKNRNNTNNNGVILGIYDNVDPNAADNFLQAEVGSFGQFVFDTNDLDVSGDFPEYHPMGINLIGFSFNKPDGLGGFIHAMAVNGSEPVTQNSSSKISVDLANPAALYLMGVKPIFEEFNWNPNMASFTNARSAAYFRSCRIYNDADETKLPERTAIAWDPPTRIGSSTTTYISDDEQTVVIPSCAEDDLLLAAVHHVDDITPPAGWTLVDSCSFTANASMALRVSVYSKVAVDEDSGANSVWTQDSSGMLAVQITSWRKASGTPVILSALAGENADPVAPWGVSNYMRPPRIQVTDYEQVGYVAVSWNPVLGLSGGPEITDSAGTKNTTKALNGWTLETPANVDDNRLGVMWRLLGPPKWIEAEEDGGGLRGVIYDETIATIKASSYGFVSILME